MDTLVREWLRLDKDEVTRSEIQRLVDNHDTYELENRLGTSKFKVLVSFLSVCLHNSHAASASEDFVLEAFCFLLVKD